MMKQLLHIPNEKKLIPISIATEIFNELLMKDIDVDDKMFLIKHGQNFILEELKKRKNETVNSIEINNHTYLIQNQYSPELLITPIKEFSTVAKNIGKFLGLEDSPEIIELEICIVEAHYKVLHLKNDEIMDHLLKIYIDHPIYNPLHKEKIIQFILFNENEDKKTA